MKWRKKSERWQQDRYAAKKNNFIFDVSEGSGGFYITCRHAKKDISYNSLWKNLTFKTLEEAKKFCEAFQHERYKCCGEDS